MPPLRCRPLDARRPTALPACAVAAATALAAITVVPGCVWLAAPRPALLRRLPAGNLRRPPTRVAGAALRTLTEQLPELDYEGLDSLELEEEELEEELEENAEEEAMDDPGTGIERLERLWERYKDDLEDPEVDDEEFRLLHSQLRLDAPRCPSASTVAWIAHALEHLGLEDDETFEVIETELLERAGELGPESLLHAVCAFGNVFWVGPDKDRRLLTALADHVRQQLADFTLMEVVRLANGMMRLDARNDSKYAGLFFEMSKRVYLPDAEDYIKRAAITDATVTKPPSGEIVGFLEDFKRHLPKGKKMPADMAEQIQYAFEQGGKAQKLDSAAKGALPGPSESSEQILADARNILDKTARGTWKSEPPPGA